MEILNFMSPEGAYAVSKGVGVISSVNSALTPGYGRDFTAPFWVQLRTPKLMRGILGEQARMPLVVPGSCKAMIQREENKESSPRPNKFANLEKKCPVRPLACSPEMPPSESS